MQKSFNVERRSFPCGCSSSCRRSRSSRQMTTYRDHDIVLLFLRRRQMDLQLSILSAGVLRWSTLYFASRFKIRHVKDILELRVSFVNSQPKLIGVICSDSQDINPLLSEVYKNSVWLLLSPTATTKSQHRSHHVAQQPSKTDVKYHHSANKPLN